MDAHAKPPLSTGEVDRLLYTKTDHLRNPGSLILDHASRKTGLHGASGQGEMF